MLPRPSSSRSTAVLSCKLKFVKTLRKIKRNSLAHRDCCTRHDCRLLTLLLTVLWGVVNASVESRAAGLPAEMYTLDDDYRALLDTNLLSAVAVTCAFLPMVMSSQGRIVNTGCLTALVDVPANVAYSASMSALVAWSESLRSFSHILNKLIKKMLY